LVQPQLRQPSRDAQTTTAGLGLLHALLGHYARLLWDLQKARIAMTHRAAAMERDGLALEWRLPLITAASDLKAQEHAVDLQLRRLARQHFLAGWVRRAPGIGLPGFARLVAITGSLDRFGNPAKLWKYLGMHVADGTAPRRRRGQRANFSPQGRVVCHQLGDSISKLKPGNGPYRAAYDRKKAEYLARPRGGPSACPFGQTHTNRQGEPVQCGRMHAHVAAMRYAVKVLLRDLWVAWRTYGPVGVGVADAAPGRSS